MKLSILIPQYKETEEQVKPLLDSIALQQNIDFNEIEVVIVNDGTDVILSEDFIDSYPFTVNYFINEHLGVSGTRDICFQFSKGDYVMFCDADDMFIDMRGLFWIFGEIDRGFDSLISYFIEEVKTPDGKTLYIEHKEQDGTFVHGKVFNREFLKLFNIKWNYGLTIHEDSFFVFQAINCSRKDRCRMVIKPFYLWKWNGDSVCRHDKKYILKTYDKMIDSTDCLIDEFMQKGLIQQARESAARIIFDTYLLLNKDEWYLEENKEYKEKVENRIKSFYQKNKEFYTSLDQNKKNEIYITLKTKKFKEGLIFERISFYDWIKTLGS